MRGSGPRVRGSEGSAPFLFPSSKVSLKTGYDSAARERIERRPLHFTDVVAIPRIADVVTALVQRAAGNIEKAGELDGCMNRSRLGTAEILVEHPERSRISR